MDDTTRPRIVRFKPRIELIGGLVTGSCLSKRR